MTGKLSKSVERTRKGRMAVYVFIIGYETHPAIGGQRADYDGGVADGWLQRGA
jgi:hypothetical protein